MLSTQQHDYGVSRLDTNVSLLTYTNEKNSPISPLFGLDAGVCAEKNLGVGTPAPNPNAALHVESPTNDQGFIMPRLTTAQRTSLATVLTATDNGLMLYDTDLKTIYIWDGAFWKNSAQVAGGNRLSYPYKDSVTTAVTGNDVFALKYNNAAGKRVLRVESLNPANGSSAVSVLQNGTGLGIFSSVSNPTSGTTAIYGTTNSNLGLFGNNLTPVGVYGEATGTGSVAGSFRINNATNTFSALYSETNGTGPAARINAINANSTAPALEVIKAGTGNAIQTTGKIQAGQFIGDGSGLTNVKSSGLLYPFKDSVTTTLTGRDLFALKYNNAASKRVLRVESLNPANGSSAVSVLQNGTGIGIFSQVNNASAGTSAIYGTTNSNLGGELAPVGVYGESTGTGSVAGSFRINNATNTFPALYSETNGTGPAARINATNANSTAPALEVIKAGTGNAIQTTGKIQAGQFIGDGSLLTGISGSGSKSKYVITDPASTDTTLTAKTYSNKPGAYAISGIQKGTGAAAGYFSVDNPNNFEPALIAENKGGGFGLLATSYAQVNIFAENKGANDGFAGLFQNSNATNTFPAIQANSNGTGSAIRAFQGTTNGDGPGIDIFMQKPTSPATALVINGNHSGSGVQVNMNTAASTAVGLNVNQKGLQAAANFNIDNAANNISTINANTNGTGNGGYFAINNPSSGAAGLFSQTNGTGAAIQGQTSTGFTAVYGRREGASNGSAGQFDITNADNGGAALQASTVGTGFAGTFNINNASNSNAAVAGGTNGTGGAGVFVVTNAANVNNAVFGTTNGVGTGGYFSNTSSGSGNAAKFAVANATNIGSAFQATTNGLGKVGDLSITNTANTSSALGVNTIGTGAAGSFNINNAANTNSVITANTNGTGDGVFSQLNNATSTNTAIKGRSTNVGGGAGAFEIFNATNPRSAVYAVTQGTGSAATFDVNNAASGAAALFSQTNGTGTAITGQTSTGFASIWGRREGATTGSAGQFDITNAGNSGFALQASTVGTGYAVGAAINNAANSASALLATTNGTGSALVAFNNGPGGVFSPAANFSIEGATNNSPTIQAQTKGTGHAGSFFINNAASGSAALQASTNGTGAAIQGTTSTGWTAVYGRREGATNGNAGKFEITSSGNTFPALDAVTIGTEGVAFVANHNGSSGQIAFFQSGGTNVARIDKTGKGFFNGGTQSSGADVAEMFDVEGSKSQYEPGDVLVISEANDRTVEKSSAPASTKVVGVYATKPGVVLTEKSIEESLDELVPMGVIGVIPTKVCLENGPIKRGDLLVTSSKQGHAMKAIPVNVGGVLIYPTGAILGKALENFEGQEAGLIKVLVNVK